MALDNNGSGTQALSNATTWVKAFDKTTAGSACGVYSVENAAASANDIEVLVTRGGVRFADSAAVIAASRVGAFVAAGKSVTFYGLTEGGGDRTIDQVWIRSLSATAYCTNKDS